MKLPMVLLLVATSGTACSAVPAMDITPRRSLSPAPKAVPVTRSMTASPVGHSRLVEGVPLQAPDGYLNYCLSNAADCQSSTVQTVTWNKELQQTVSAVNIDVNRSISPANDAFEEWSASVSKGDCEDYALTKRRALIESGLPPSALRIAVAITAAGEMHAVLVMKTTSGDLVFDNRNDLIVDPNSTDLQWIKMASSDDPRRWTAVRAVTK